MDLLELVCASANPDKVAEIAAMLDGCVHLVARPADLADVVEDADTLEGNARLKAAAVCAATGMPAVADDTGLFVDALDGAPGVFTARYAGEHATYADNRAKMLDALKDVIEAEPRSARFVTVAMVVWPDGSELAVRGVCEGAIAPEERGDRGFGYDAVFVPHEGGGRTFAEMTDSEKNAMSHRGKAFAGLLRALTER
ncbi:MAG: hypothetical protein RLZZ623_670 [Actinomycetota bacterium]|jgi:XTP/dITP diphosphohydrolase